MDQQSNEQKADSLLGAARDWQNGTRTAEPSGVVEEVREHISDRDVLFRHGVSYSSQAHMDMMASAALSEVGGLGFEIA